MKRGPNSNVFLAMIVCSVLFGLGINYFAYSKITQETQDVAAVRADVDSVSKVPARLQESTRALQDAQTALKHLEQGVSASSYVPTLMRQLEDLGNSCGVEVTAVRPVPAAAVVPTPKGQKEAPKPYDTLDIEVRGLAHYREALKFVSSLDSFPKVVEARTVSLEPEAHNDRKDLSGSPRLTVTILLRAYLFKGDSRTAMAGFEVKHAG